MFCPKCGTQNIDTARFCRKCGKNLPERSQVIQVVTPVDGDAFLGQVLDGKYRIDGKLGSGGMGDVYRATRMLIGDTVAVKILHPHLARDPQAAERFRREAVMATKLRHRNVVGIYDVGVSAVHQVPYILMELAEGYTLRQIINQYRVLPLDFAVTVTTQVCSALGEAHELGIVHRDIKPENIVANETTTGWYVKVLDFGIAKLYNQTDIGLTQDGSAMGTPQYMSPEQCLGETLDARSDVYSVGIMLYEMLTGTVPFKSPTASAIAIHHVQTMPQAPRLVNDQIHPAVEGVILKSIWKEREQRHQNASELAKDLINAATVAFKSGNVVVAETPIAAPEIEPEFATVDEIISDEASVEVSDEPNANAEPQEIEEDEPETSATIEPEVENASSNEIPIAAPAADESDASTDDFDPYATMPAVGQPTHSWKRDPDKAKIAEEPDPPSFPESENFGDGSVATGVEVIEETAVEPSTLAITEVLELADVVTVANIEPVEEDADLSAIGQPDEHELARVFEDAELLLDDIFVEQPVISSDSISDTDVIEKVVAPSQTDNISRGNDEIADEPAILTETAPKRSKPWPLIIAGVGAALVLLVVLTGLGIWALLSSQQSSASPTSGEQPPAPSTNLTSAPTGMVLVTGAEFMVGSDKGDEYSRPAHKVTVGSFFIDVNEVTNEEYKKFVDEKGHKPPPQWKNGTFREGQAKFPVTGVNWDDANAYAAWAGKRLPTEEEWEFAARGTDGRMYPWGNEWISDTANADNRTRGMREVGQGDGKSPFGLFDMAGNAWEWTSSDAKPFPGGKEFAQGKGVMKIIRGGYWGSKRDVASSVGRRAYGTSGESEGYSNTGIRCVKALEK